LIGLPFFKSKIMSTINEIVFKIKERHASFKLTDDYKVADELIISMMNDVRETLIREEKVRNGFISADFYQMDCCYEVKCVEESCTYNGSVVPSGNPVYQIKLKGLVKGVVYANLAYVGNKTGSVQFHVMNTNQYFASDGRMWTKGKPAATVIGDTLFLKNLPTEGFKFVCLNALLRDPRTACDWRTDESDYPVPSETKLIDMVLYRIQLSGRVPDDKVNNAADDTVPPRAADEAVGALQQMTTENRVPQQRQ